MQGPIRDVDTGRAEIKHWTRGVQFEGAAVDQVRRLASMPFIFRHVAIMPDVHAGIGATVGSVIATKGAIIPAAVGVDIGCGMMAVQTNIRAEDLPDDLHTMRSQIEGSVPIGRTDDGGPNDRGSWDFVPADVRAAWEGPLAEEYASLVKQEARIGQGRSLHHLGTLGTGNHFIEVCLDLAGSVWVMLHSGSRGVGNRIGQTYIERAKEDMRRWFINLPDKDLAYLPQGSEHYGPYCKAVAWAQRFAKANREIMMARTLGAMEYVLRRPVTGVAEAINCHHNYVSHEKHFGSDVLVTRKGAVRADEGMLGIIPGSMGARSFIVRGKGNRDSFCSCSHGAGRVMSRGQAKRLFTLEDHAQATAGVECRKDADVIDETPKAYKDIDAVMAAQADLVDVVAELKQVLCVKG